MKVLIIGSGGREHALCHACKKSPKVEEIFCIPGNAGTESIARNYELDTKNFQKIKEFINHYKIDLVIIGPEQPLVDGIVDYLNENHIVPITLELNANNKYLNGFFHQWTTQNNIPFKVTYEIVNGSKFKSPTVYLVFLFLLW